MSEQLHLWNELEPGIRRLAYHFAPHAQRNGLEVDDLMQEAFLKFPAAVSRYDPTRNVPLAQWINLVLARHFISVARMGARFPRNSLDGLADLIRDKSSTATWARLVIEDALAGVFPHDRQRDRKIRVFSKYWLEGFTMGELARQEGVGITTIWNWLKAVRKALRLVLAEADPDNSSAGRHARPAVAA